MSRVWARWLVVLLAGLVITACGAPTSGVRPIEADEVPYDLLSPAPTGRPTTPSPAPTQSGQVPSEVYFVDTKDQLVAVDAPTGDGLPEEIVSGLLSELEAGPGTDPRRDGLASALGPEVTLRLVRVLGATAYVEVANAARDPSASQLPLAIGQIVLTATSSTGIDRVVIFLDGERVDVPLPGGQLTSGPVTADDYASLIAPSPT